MKIRPVGAGLFHVDGWTDRQTDRDMTKLIAAFLNFMNRGIATRYGLHGPGIESRWGIDFSCPSRPVLGPTQPPIQWVPGLSRSKKAGRGADHPPPSSVEVKESVGLYCHSTTGSSWPLIG
jgi:hypothetical protein